MVNKQDLISNILSTAALGLPGLEAHATRSPLSLENYKIPLSGYREASVLFLLYPKNNVWHTCYIKRSSYDLRDKHAGQIGLPGGKVEMEDADLSMTARREVEEEVGVSRHDIEIVTELTQLYVQPSNFIIYPFVGIIDFTPTFIKQDTEVELIIETPLSYLVNDMVSKHGNINVRSVEMTNVPFYDLCGHNLWGATSMITAEFIELLKPVYQPVKQ